MPKRPIRKFRSVILSTISALVALLDEPGSLEHLQVLRDRRQAEVERSGQLRHGGLAFGESREDGPASRIGQGRKGGAERIRLRLHFSMWLINLVA